MWKLGLRPDIPFLGIFVSKFCLCSVVIELNSLMKLFRAYQRLMEARGEEEPRLPGLPKYTPRQLFWMSTASVW